MALKRYIEQLSTDMGFEQALDANDDGSYSLLFEPDINVTVRECPDSNIILHTKVAPLPTTRTEEFLLKTMIANLFGKETGGAAIGLDNEGKMVVLLDFVQDQSGYRLFHEQLEDFVNYADAWRQETIEFAEQKDIEA